MGWTANAGGTAKRGVDWSEPVVSRPASEQPRRANRIPPGPGQACACFGAAAGPRREEASTRNEIGKGRESLPTLLALPGLPCLPCLLGKSRRRGRCGLRLWDGGGNYAASRSTLYSTPRALGCRRWPCSRRLAVRGFADAERFDRRDRRMAVLLFSQGNRLDQRY